MAVDELVTALREFATTLEVTHAGNRRSWADHTDVKRPGFVDEESLVQPKVFPAFARRFLGWTVGTDLAAETTGQAGTPDFTPSDRITHAFVFETKGTDKQDALSGVEEQVARYLSSQHVDRVVVTNMISVRVFCRGTAGDLVEDYAFSLRGLWSHQHEMAVRLTDAQRFERFVAEFSRRELTSEEKIDRIRTAKEWTGTEQTDAEWLRTRIGRVVDIFKREVGSRVAAGAITDRNSMLAKERAAVLDELRGLLVRFGVALEDAEELDLDTIVHSNSALHVAAREQYIAHVAYWLTIKLVLVRVWEDLGLISPARLYDGGFDDAMSRFNGGVLDVIRDAFSDAERHYRALFVSQMTYSWYEPSRDIAVEGLYELANTYLGHVESDVLGEVYETMLQRIDRKLLGQYYTPRDVVRLMWDLVVDDNFRDAVDAGGRALRVLDIATGSGGFLVEGVVRERARLGWKEAAGSRVNRQRWMNDVAESYNGVEYQRFSAFLAELNLLIQFSQVLAEDASLQIPELSVLNADTLTLHNPDLSLDELGAAASPLIVGGERQHVAARIADPGSADFWFDVAVGNPPYIGAKGGASTLLARLEERHGYWRQFNAAHRDYLYAFLILGISKLRPGGRFAFITTEYWLRATGAAPLRGYLASHCDIDRLLLFRNLKLFPEAEGQHNLVVVGTRVSSEVNPSSRPKESLPRVSIYEGPNVAADERSHILSAMGSGETRAGVRSFRAAASPNALRESPWFEASISGPQARRRRAVLERPQLARVKTTEGVIATAQAVNNKLLLHMSAEKRQSHPRGTGIFVLSPEEILALGKLNLEERDIVRPVINTSDVLPYAVVLPANPEMFLYLPVPTDLPTALTKQQVIHTALPAGIPTIAAHLEPFRLPLAELMEASPDSRYQRPWWTLHDDRRAALSAAGTGRWASFCVTSRWGGGGRLIVGLAPARAVPKSGLHMVYATDKTHGRHAAYLAGIYNSELVQQLADTLAPGQTRGGEIEAFGLPDVDPATRNTIAEAAFLLAEVVTNAASQGGVFDNFPQMRDLLRSDVTLGELPVAWSLSAGSANLWGTVETVQWLQVADSTGPQAKAVTGSSFDTTLVGDVLRLHHSSPANEAHLDVHIAAGGGLTKRDRFALAAWAEGLVARRTELRQVTSQSVPTGFRNFVEKHATDRDALERFAAAYREQRAVIDAAIM